METMKFENIFRISTFAMRLNRSHPALPQNMFWKLQFCTIMCINLVSFCWLTNSLLFYDIPAKKYTEASKVCAMIIISFVVTFKFFILVFYQNGIVELIRIVDKDYELAQHFTKEEQEIVQKYARRGVRVCRQWLISLFITCTIFPCKSLLLMAIKYWQGKPEFIPVLDFTYPVFIESYKHIPFVFWFQFIFCLTFDCYASCFYMGFDPLVPIFLLHACGQLDLASRRIMALYSESLNDEQINQKLKEIVEHLQSIYRFIDDVKEYFTVFYEFNMKSTTFQIPFTAWQIVESLHHNEVNVEFMAFLTSAFLHFLMPCYYGDVLMETSERFRLAIYFSGWEKHQNLRIRKRLLYMLSRASIPLVLRTIFYPICLDTFAKMCRTSYTIFNLMNAAFT